jgi:hypothetical protein
MFSFRCWPILCLYCGLSYTHCPESNYIVCCHCNTVSRETPAGCAKVTILSSAAGCTLLRGCDRINFFSASGALTTLSSGFQLLFLRVEGWLSALSDLAGAYSCAVAQPLSHPVQRDKTSFMKEDRLGECNGIPVQSLNPGSSGCEEYLARSVSGCRHLAGLSKQTVCQLDSREPVPILMLFQMLLECHLLPEMVPRWLV